MHAGRALDLYSVRSGEDHGLRGEILCHEGLLKDLGRTIVLRAACAITKQARSLQVGTHARDKRADHAEVATGPVADLAGGRMSYAFLEAAPQQAQCRASR